jgi:hypothetical protein
MVVVNERIRDGHAYASPLRPILRPLRAPAPRGGPSSRPCAPCASRDIWDMVAPKPWADCAPRLVTVAAGRAPADLVIRGGTLVNVQSREVLPGWQVASRRGPLRLCRPRREPLHRRGHRGRGREGRYLIPASATATCTSSPGCSPRRVRAAVIPHGTTTMFADPHEIANVLGPARRAHDARRGGSPARQHLHPDAVLRALRPGPRDDRASRSPKRTSRRPWPGPASSAWAR